MSMMNPLAGPAGPGKFSTRTDNLQMGSIAYGEGVETQAIKSGAPLARTAGVSASDAPAVPTGSTPGLYDNTAFPDRNIMNGTDAGPGVGSEALMMNQSQQGESDIIAKYMPALDAMASAPDSPQSFRIFVRSLQGNM